MQVVVRGLVALGRHLRADLLRQTIDVPAADRHFRRHLQNLRGHGMRFDLPRHVHDLVQDRRAVAVPINLQQRTLREKKPDDTSSSNRPARGAERFRRARG